MDEDRYSLLTPLPKSILLDIIQVWLIAPKDLAHFDGALTNRVLRKQYIKWCRSDVIQLHGDFSILSVSSFKSFARWKLKRSFAVISLGMRFDDLPLQRLAQHFTSLKKLTIEQHGFSKYFIDISPVLDLFQLDTLILRDLSLLYSKECIMNQTRTTNIKTLTIANCRLMHPSFRKKADYEKALPKKSSKLVKVYHWFSNRLTVTEPKEKEKEETMLKQPSSDVKNETDDETTSDGKTTVVDGSGDNEDEENGVYEEEEETEDESEAYKKYFLWFFNRCQLLEHLSLTIAPSTIPHTLLGQILLSTPRLSHCILHFNHQEHKPAAPWSLETARFIDDHQLPQIRQIELTTTIIRTGEQSYCPSCPMLLLCCPNITHLTLHLVHLATEHPALQGHVMEWFAQHSAQLTYLHLSFQGLPAQVIQHIACYSKSLHTLRISDGKDITEETLYPLSHEQITSLHTLSFHRCVGITDKIMKRFCHSTNNTMFPTIEALEIIDCPALTITGISSLLACLPKCKSLHIEFAATNFMSSSFAFFTADEKERESHFMLMQYLTAFFAPNNPLAYRLEQLVFKLPRSFVFLKDQLEQMRLQWSFPFPRLRGCTIELEFDLSMSDTMIEDVLFPMIFKSCGRLTHLQIKLNSYSGRKEYTGSVYLQSLRRKYTSNSSKIAVELPRKFQLKYTVES